MITWLKNRRTPVILSTLLLIAGISTIFILTSSEYATAVIVEKRPFELNAATKKFAIAKTEIKSKAEKLMVKISRPTTTNPLAWDESSTMKVNIVLEVDGVEYRASGQVTGGIRSRNGIESDYYTMTYTPPWGFFGARGGDTKRLGETKTSTYTARVELELLSGSISSDIEMIYDIAPAPDIAFHSSVAFDTASGTTEGDGDGILSVSHTSSGSNRAVFVGAGHQDDATDVTATYAGTSMNRQWFDTTNPGKPGTYTGFTLAGQSTEAQTVTVTFTGGSDFSTEIGVISMTGVDQTTPVGTPATAEHLTSTTPSVTVGSVGADDMVVDCLVTDYTGTQAAGADQDGRVDQNELTWDQYLNCSTQPGSAGGDMSWTLSGGAFQYSMGWGLGAIAFKAAANDRDASVPSVKVASHSGSDTAWYDSTWGFRKRISVDPYKVSGTSGHTNFPMLFSVTDPDLADTGSGGGVASSTAGDILFIDWEGNKIDHEIEKYTNTTGELVAWVEMPFVSSTSTRTIHMYYGNAAASYQPTNSATWNDNYAGVWHLDEGDSTDADFYKDSKGILDAGNSRDGTLVDADADTTAATGKADGALDFNGDADYLDIDGYKGISGSAARTVSGWFKTSATGVQPLVFWGSDNGAEIGTGFAHYIESGVFWGRFYSSRTYNGGTNFNDGEGHHFATTYPSGGQLQTSVVYIDGNSISLTFANGTTVLNTGTTLDVHWANGGRNQGATLNYLDGMLDEIRLSSTDLTESWVKTEYNNQSRPTSFYSYGGQEAEARQDASGDPAPAVKLRGGVKFR